MTKDVMVFLTVTINQMNFLVVYFKNYSAIINYVKNISLEVLPNGKIIISWETVTDDEIRFAVTLLNW